MSATTQTLIDVARRSQEWLRERPLVYDVAFAGTAALLALGELTSESSVGGREPDLLAVALVLFGAVLLIWRRSTPIAVAIAIAILSCVFYTRNYGSFMAFIGLTSMYSVAAHEQNRRAAWITLVTMSTGLVILAGFTVLHTADGFSIPDATGMIVSIGAVVVAGGVIRNKDEIFADTEARAERAEAEQKAQAEQAVTRERLRIAREMHDIVAHGMSLITVQAAAAQEIVETRPEDAAQLMRSVETTGRDALVEMRRMLGVLRNGERNDDDQNQLIPQPSLHDLDTIIDHCTQAGTPTTLSISGDQRPLSTGIELAIFRIVQEALTNVVKHGGEAATASVELRYRVDELQATISDTGRGAVSDLTPTEGGHGLIGMRERVEIYDGRLVAGPRPGGGYEVDVFLPIRASHQPEPMAAPETQSTPST